MNLDQMVALLAKTEKGTIDEAVSMSKGMAWIPSPGPQTDAYFSKADVLLYGGEPGGGKTSLEIGLSLTAHTRSLILRRQYTDLGAIVEEAIRFNGTRKGYNGSPPPSLRTVDGRFIEFGAAARIGDEQHWMGNPHDLICLDEATHFAETQVRFFMGWNRSVDVGQRCRVVLATNPPLSSEGVWVIEMFAPWLDPRHPNPAKFGELRWYVTDENGQDKEVNGPEPTLVGEKLVTPMSRTFIPAGLSDNPFLVNTDYQSRLDALTEPFRSILLGGFLASFKDAEGQCIPTAWIKAAQQRWREHPKPPKDVPMCAMGVDVAQGGDDETVLAPRYDDWFAEMITKPGRETPLGRDVAGFIVANRQDSAIVVLDMGGGYGGSTYEHLVENEIEVRAYKGAAGVETRTKDRQMKFTNKRTEAYYRLREALDPSQEGGSTIALPDDPKLTADLTAPTVKTTRRGLELESKEDVCKRLGRSTDRGDAVVMAFSDGPKFITDGGVWKDKAAMGLKGRTPKVITARDRRK